MAVNNSIRTNPSAFSALRTLSSINRRADTIQNQVSTGLKVAGPLEDASSFAIAQGIRGEVKAISAVNQGLRAALGVVKVGIAAATAVSEILTDMREKTVAGRNAGLTEQQRAIINDDFLELRDQFEGLVNDAQFNGKNLIVNGSTAMTVLSNIEGGSYTIASYQISAINLDFGSADANLQSVANSEASDGYVVEALQTVGTALGGLGASARFLQSQIAFNEQVSDATEEGLGNIVDADLARASAELSAVQVQEQLSIQTLGIANQRPSTLIGLFN